MWEVSSHVLLKESVFCQACSLWTRWEYCLVFSDCNTSSIRFSLIVCYILNNNYILKGIYSQIVVMITVIMDFIDTHHVPGTVLSALVLARTPWGRCLNFHMGSLKLVEFSGSPEIPQQLCAGGRVWTHMGLTRTPVLWITLWLSLTVDPGRWCSWVYDDVFIQSENAKSLGMSNQWKTYWGSQRGYVQAQWGKGSCVWSVTLRLGQAAFYPVAEECQPRPGEKHYSN